MSCSNCNLRESCLLRSFSDLLEGDSGAVISERVMGKGDSLMRNEAIGKTVLMVKSGIMRFYTVTEDGDTVTFALFGPGQTIGESEAFLTERSELYFEALSRVVLCEAPLVRFRNVSRGSTKLLIEIICCSMNNSNAFCRFAWVGAERVAQKRVLKFLVVLTDLGFEADRDGMVRADLSHSDISDLLKMGRATVSSVLESLQEGGYVELRYGYLLVNRDRVKALFSSDGIPYPTFVFDGDVSE